MRGVLLTDFALLTVALLWGAGGCATNVPLGARLDPRVERPHPGLVLFLCDGMHADYVDRGWREGWLPNIRSRFVEGGARVENAITVFPAITYTAITSLLTGVSPPRHGITGNRWFDPELRLFRNYVKLNHYRDINGDIDVPTIYERLAPRYTLNIQTALTRGVSDNIANWTQSGVRWFFGEYAAVDALSAQTIELAAAHARARGAWPTLLTCYFPGLDTIGHQHGPHSDAYHDALVHIDFQIGRVCDWLASQGLLKTTYVVLVSDHGHVDVEPNGYFDLMQLVRAWGYHPTDRMDQDDPYPERRRFFERFDSVVAYQNGRKALLHFRGPTGWDEPLTPAAVADILHRPPPAQRLWNLPAVDLTMYLAGPHQAVLRSARGNACIAERDTPNGPEYEYRAEPGDPLGYLSDSKLAAFVAAGFHSSRDWLAATCREEFPDLVPQILPLLRLRRAGQVVICAAPGYSFKRELGGHGGIRRAEMRVPMMLAGPGIQPGSTLECARAVDVLPTLLTLLGLEVPDDGLLEGVPLLTVPAGVLKEP